MELGWVWVLKKNWVLKLRFVYFKHLRWLGGVATGAECGNIQNSHSVATLLDVVKVRF